MRGDMAPTAPDRRRLMGRLAAVLFLCSGAILLATVPVLASDASETGTVVVVVLALALGVVAWLAPWDRWPAWAAALLAPPAFALIAFGNAYGGSDQHAYGVFFVVAFVWIGLAQPPWTSLAMAPVAAVAYVVPLHSLPGDLSDGVVSGAMTIAACVMVGEALSWGAARLSHTEQALEEERDASRRHAELDRMKSTFLSTASHELRTPITICRGHLEVLADDPAPSAVAETTALLLDELDAMGRLIDDLSVMARGNDGSTLHRVPTDVAELIGDVALKVKPFLNGRLRVDAVPASAVVDADPLRLRQALVNLLRNAAIHGDGEGPVEMHVRSARHAWRFEVADDGGGIETGDEDRVFEHFWRGHTSAGSGLGLAVVRSIALAHGGDAGVENRPGEGATFWLTIPR